MNKCREIWKNFELDRKRDLFDSQGINISKAREQSAANRKNLAQITKDFKKLSNEEKVSSFQKVLKAYQEEIDSLTNRSVSAEKLFLDLYQPLREAPDPYFIICKYQQLIQQQSQQQSNQEEYEKTISELKNQLNDYENEFMHLKNQEVTIRKLEEEVLKYKNQSELLKEHDFIIQKHKDREIIILNELKEIKTENERLNNLYIDTQNLNYELKTRLEEIEASRQYQIDLHQERVLQLENQILELKSQTKTSITEHLEGSIDEQIAINEMKTEYLKKISELKEDVKEKNHKIQQLHQQLQQQQQVILNIQNEMAQLPTRETLQKLQERINTLQQLEFGYDSNSQEKSVEQLLKEKVIKLENDLTKSNQNNREKDEKIEALNSQLNELSVKASEQLKTIEKLEANVDQLMKSSTLPSNTEEVSISEPQSLISILTEQRNRFRDKYNTLEEENLKLKQHIEHLENEQSKLRKENLKLYEKTKYLQFYNQNALSSTNKPSSSQDYEPIQNKYEQLYEQELDPFKRFHRKEREERLNNMTAAEKVIYRCSSLMLSHKLGRMFLFFYLLALHTLVFFTLSKLSGLTIRRK